MSFADDAEFSAFIAGDERLPCVTAETVAKAMEGFALHLLPGKDMQWLAMAVRRALAITMQTVMDGPSRISDVDIQKELNRLSSLAKSAWVELSQCDVAADSCLWFYAWRNWDDEGCTELEGVISMDDSGDYHRFKAAVAELDWLAGFMREAAKSIKPPKGPWRHSESKKLRTERGHYLAPIFEAAFGQAVSANNYPSDVVSKAPTAFMDFYERMVTLAFGRKEISNLCEVLKAACHLHRQQPVDFAAEIIPGL